MSEHLDTSSDTPRDDRWVFTVTWDPDKGTLPNPILMLFRGSRTVRPGECVRVTDRGHAAHYVKAVQVYVQQHWPDRDDITASAAEVPGTGPVPLTTDQPVTPAKRCHWCDKTATGTALAALWENGRVVSRLGGRFASCEDQHGTGYTAFAATN